jgi:hypothetical protein
MAASGCSSPMADRMKFQRSPSPVNTNNHTHPRRDGGRTLRTSPSTSASAGLVNPSRAAESHTRAICSRSSLRISGGSVLGPSPGLAIYRRLPSGSSIIRLVRRSAWSPSGRDRMVKSTEKSSGIAPKGSTLCGVATHELKSSNKNTGKWPRIMAMSIRPASPR